MVRHLANVSFVGSRLFFTSAFNERFGFKAWLLDRSIRAFSFPLSVPDFFACIQHVQMMFYIAFLRYYPAALCRKLGFASSFGMLCFVFIASLSLTRAHFFAI